MSEKEIFNNIKTPKELLDFMNNNITYGFLGKNGKKYYNMYSEEWNDWYSECFVQNGSELLNSKIGTCWDQVELERDWFQKNNYNFKTFYIWFEIDRDISLPNHTFLIYEKDGKYYWFEHAFSIYRGIYEFDSEIEAIDYVKEKHFEYASKINNELTEYDKKNLIVYDYSKPNDSLGVEEFIKHVTSKKYSKSK